MKVRRVASWGLKAELDMNIFEQVIHSAFGWFAAFGYERGQKAFGQAVSIWTIAGEAINLHQVIFVIVQVHHDAIDFFDSAFMLWVSSHISPL
jgi:hypothetical protein